MSRTLLTLAATALLAAAGGYLASRLIFSDTVGLTPEPAVELVGQRRPGFAHPDIDGRPRSVQEFDGRVLLVNFWASWCTPCVEEMPMLSELQRRYGGEGLQVIGIAVDEPARARQFAADLDLSYPVLTGGAEVVVTGRRYGNGSGLLPYSVLTDRDGVVRWTRLGVLDADRLEEKVRLLLSDN